MTEANTIPRQVWPEDLAARYRSKGYWRGETFGDVLRARAADHPDRLAVVDADNRWTYADLLARAESAAGGYLALGLQPGDRVVVEGAQKLYPDAKVVPEPVDDQPQAAAEQSAPPAVQAAKNEG